jgi:hypothetical protein
MNGSEQNSQNFGSYAQPLLDAAGFNAPKKMWDNVKNISRKLSETLPGNSSKISEKVNPLVGVIDKGVDVVASPYKLPKLLKEAATFTKKTLKPNDTHNILSGK